MVDTLKLHLADVHVDMFPQLTIEPATINARNNERAAEELLWYDPNGKAIFGKKGYHNAKDFNLTAHGQARWMLQFSVPKIADGRLNVNAVDSRTASDVIDKMQQKLHGIGIETNLRKAYVSRVDVFRNGVMKHPVTHYLRMLGDLPEGRRMKQRDYGDSVLFHNTQRELCLYDKVVELGNRGIDLKDWGNQNILRCELRLIRGRVVKQERIRQVPELLAIWDDLGEIYGRHVNAILVRGTINAKCYTTELERMRAYRDSNSKRTAWSNTVKRYGLHAIYEAFGNNPDLAIKAISETHGANVGYKAKADFQGIAAEFGRWNSPDVTGAELWSEFQTKILSKVA